MKNQLILGDEGYNVKFFQLSSVKHLSLALYSTKLIITNINNGEVIEDTPLEDVTSIKAVNAATSTIGPATGANIKVRTKHGYYKISWKDVDLLRIGLREVGQAYNQLSGYEKATKWQETFEKLKSGQDVDPIQNNIGSFEKNIAKPKNNKKPILGLVLILFPIIAFIAGGTLVYFGFHDYQGQGHPDPLIPYGLIITAISLLIMPWSIIWGIRKLK